MVKLAVWLFEKTAALARRRLAVCLLLTALPIAIRVGSLRILPMPDPSVHDEFSYLLGADTFASGRLTNPPHPMWVHFETFHENFQPTYASKYPPAQALFMAFGQKFFHHPWFGVCISFGVMCGAICWMLQGWLPPVYALLGGLIAMGQFSIFGPWMDTYWGGAVPAIGGSLVLGAVARLAKTSSATASALGALGLWILANSRPYEGLALSLAAIVGLLWWRYRSGRRLTGLLAPRVLIPGLLVCAAGFSWDAFYNYRVTGDPLLMPYTLNERTYAINSAFFLAPPRPEPVYRHEMIRAFWVDFEKVYYLKTRRNPLRTFAAFKVIVPFYASTLLFPAALAGMLGFTRSRKIRVMIGVMVVLWAALMLEKSWVTHYFAPGAALLLIPTMFSLRWLRVRLGAVGTSIVMLFVLCCFGHGLAKVMYARDDYSTPPEEYARQKVLANGKPGDKHLVIVRYAPGHSPHVEFVFNRADIDRSAIVWARDMGAAKNQELLDYYPDRKAWLLEPDSKLLLTPLRGETR